jgi:hypothetical protein
MSQSAVSLPKEEIALTPNDKILEKIKKYRPSQGGAVPANLNHRLGAAHAAGRYHLTNEPFLLEGAKKLLEFGTNICKLWLDSKELKRLYGFNSDWSALPRKFRPIDIVKHPYFEEVFHLPFSTIVLETTRLTGVRPYNSPDNCFIDTPDDDFSEYEDMFEELTEHFYKRFSKRPITFILQNWEGDWLFNGETVTVWNQQMLDDLPRRVDCYTRWFAARQRGVEKARKRFADDKSVACRVLHAVEVNRVLTLLEGTPTLTQWVLPNITPDLVSWSAYDGMGSAEDLWHGIELIRHYMKHSGFLPEPTLMVGELGYPERGRTQEEVVEFWDRSLAVFFAQNIPLIFVWELFCNEITEEAKNKPAPDNGIYPADDLCGFWLYRPDGALSHAGQFLKNLLQVNG